MYKKYIWEEKNHSHLKLGIPAPWEFLIKKTGAWRKPAPGNQANKVLPNWGTLPLAFRMQWCKKEVMGCIMHGEPDTAVSLCCRRWGTLGLVLLSSVF